MSLKDNGDGTVTDDVSLLMWEKKSATDDIHKASKTYSWSKTGTAPDGTAFTEFLAGLNGRGFAGHNDWRLPTVGELQGIVDRSRPYPAAAINEIFGPTQAGYYWSIEEAPPVGAGYALVVNFGYIDINSGLPELQNGHKVESYRCYYRAVRNLLELVTEPIPPVWN